MSRNDIAPIIIKKKKVVAGDGHHGGAWKVAYADFVTAMMAFFLLMWLLNATTDKQRKGLADYFSPTIPINNITGGGEGSLWGDDVFAEDTLAQSGSGASQSYTTDFKQAKGETGSDPTSPFTPGADGAKHAAAKHLLEDLKARGGESMAALEKMRHVVTRLTDEGLVIEIFDTDSARLFRGSTAEPTALLHETLDIVAVLADLVTNDVAISAHVASRPVVLADNPVWQLSSDRATTARTSLEQQGLSGKRVQRVTGYADRKPAVPNPLSQRNSRVEVTLLRDGV